MNSVSTLRPTYANQAVPKAIAIVFAAYAVISSVISFFGWYLPNPRLIDWWNTGINMKANATLGVFVLGVAVILMVLASHIPGLRLAARALAMMAVMLGAATIYQHLTGIDLGIDTLLFDEPAGAMATTSPGRMGVPASSSFVLLGIAVLLALGKSRARGVSSVLATIVLSVGILSLTGYWYGAEAMYALPRLTAIAVQTATMLVALSLSIIAAQPDLQPMKTLSEGGTASVLARRVVPIAIGVPLVLGWLRNVGFKEGLYDNAFGTALRTVVEIVILMAVLWWTVQAIRTRDLRNRRTEAERQSSEERFRSVLDASAVPFMVLAPVKDDSGAVIDFRWMYVNPAAARVLRNKVEHLLGRRVSHVLPGTWNETGLFEHYVAVTLRHEIRDFEVQRIVNAVEGWFQVVASPLEENVAVWFTDVTERKRQELELRSADRRKDEFLATLAHEMRNPLAPIRQAALVLKKASISESQRKWCNDVIERQVQHMSLLLEDLLDVSRITRGTLELRKQPTILSALMESAIETARPLIDSKQHTLRVEMPHETVELDIDPVRMSQVISNLLNNAGKYTNAGGMIHIKAEVISNDFMLKVVDNGIGIDQDDLRSIFKMFSQVKSAQERSEGGLGIGLAFAKGLIELHGGTIEAHSAGVGFGSTFIVRLPAVCTIVANRISRVGGPNLESDGRRILIADDNVDAAESLAMLLSNDGHNVRMAHDGEEALKKYAVFHPDVVLLDIGMPRLSGYDVARRIRETDSHALLVAITGWGQVHDRARTQAVGFDHHLTKPVDYDDIRKLLVARRVQASAT